MKTLLRCCVLLTLVLGATTGRAAIYAEWAVTNGGNGHIYGIIGSPQISWTDAKIAAENSVYMGRPGHLATLTSAAEDEFLKDTFEDLISSEYNPTNGVYAWIGLTDEVVDQTYEWVTGEAFSYAGWAPGEPQTAIGEEDYVHVWARSFFGNPTWGWNDSRNTGGFTDKDAYFVEYPVIPEPSSLLLAMSGMAVLGWIRRRRAV